MSSSESDYDSESDSGRKTKRRRATLVPLNADRALLKIERVVRRIKLGQRDEFFVPAMVMIAGALQQSSRRNAGSAHFQTASERGALEVLSTLAESTSDDEFVSGFGEETKSLSLGLSVLATTTESTDWHSGSTTTHYRSLCRNPSRENKWNLPQT